LKKRKKKTIARDIDNTRYGVYMKSTF